MPGGKENHGGQNYFAELLAGLPALAPATLDSSNALFTLASRSFDCCPVCARMPITTMAISAQTKTHSTKLSPEIAEYPDKGTFGVMTEDFRFLGKTNESKNYWDGE